jgi:hypothetical protein
MQHDYDQALDRTPRRVEVVGRVCWGNKAEKASQAVTLPRNRLEDKTWGKNVGLTVLCL